MRVPPTLSHANHRRRPSQLRLHASILHVGRLPGWGTSIIADFAVAVTGQPWNRCERADLVRVLDASLTVAYRVRTVHATQSDGCRPDRSVR
jgi:hypothetical protein